MLGHLTLSLPILIILREISWVKTLILSYIYRFLYINLIGCITNLNICLLWSVSKIDDRWETLFIGRGFDSPIKVFYFLQEINIIYTHHLGGVLKSLPQSISNRKWIIAIRLSSSRVRLFKHASNWVPWRSPLSIWYSTQSRIKDVYHWFLRFSILYNWIRPLNLGKVYCLLLWQISAHFHLISALMILGIRFHIDRWKRRLLFILRGLLFIHSWNLLHHVLKIALACHRSLVWHRNLWKS
jgi:hypothetical protein